jgi:GST-like protein
MFDLYSWGTPNGRKIMIAFEEMGLPYRLHKVDIGKGDQFKPEFLRISPNNKIPAITDRDNGQSIFESGAILMYLGDKTGTFYPKEQARRIEIHEWLMWQMSSLGPMLGRAHYFLHYNKGKSDFADKWFSDEAQRLYGVLDRRLEGRQHVCGDFSIVDMAVFPWLSRFEWQRVDLNAFANVKRYYLANAARAAVKRAYAHPELSGEIPMPP